MKVLTVRQPWATLLAYGEKRVECRSWRTSYRGDIIIVAAQRVDADAMRALRDAGFPIDATMFPRGAVVGVVTLADITRGCDECDAWCWQIANARPLPTPIPARGSLGLRDADSALVEAAKGALGTDG